MSNGKKHRRLLIPSAEMAVLGIQGFYPKEITKMAKRRRAKISTSANSSESSTTKDVHWDSLFTSLGRIEIVLLVGGMLLLLVLIYTIHEILSPFLALGAILFILFPLRRYVLRGILCGWQSCYLLCGF